ncbi:hypothetical protein ACFLYZ_00500 [Thermodesulfobacteriota bacterium]
MAKKDEISSTEKLLDLIRGKSAKDSDSSVVHSSHPAAAAMKLSFLRKRKLIVGVDVGLQSLRLVKISQSADKKSELLDSLRVPFDPKLPKKSPRFHRFLKSVLMKFCDSSETVEIWSAISSTNVETRYLRIPKVPKKQMFKAVFWTYKKDISFDEHNDIFDYEVLGDILEDGVSKTAVMAYSAPKREVDELKALFSKSGYPLTGISIVPFALQNLFKTQWLKNGKNVCSLFVGNDWSRIAVYSNGNLVLSRGVKSGTKSMVEAIREEIDINGLEQSLPPADGDHPPEFEDDNENYDSDTDPALKLLTGLIDDTSPLAEEEESLNANTDKLFGTIQPALDRVIRQVERTIRHYSLNFGDEGIGKVYISGKISANRHVVNYIGQQLGIPVENLDPFASQKLLSAGFSIPESESERGAFVPAVGMALSSNSFTPNFIFTYKDKEKAIVNIRIKRAMLGLFLLLMAAGVGFFLWQNSILEQKKATVAKLQMQMAQYSPVVDQNLIIQMVAKAQRNIDTAEAYVNKYFAMAVISEIVQITPSEIFLTNIAAQLESFKGSSPAPEVNKGLVLEGIIFGERLASQTLLAGYLIKLESSPMLIQPVIKKKYYDVLEDQEILRFTVELGLV